MEKGTDYNKTLHALTNGIADLPFGSISNIVRLLAKKSKKKPLTSGNLSFRDYCQLIASNLLKASNKEVLETIVRQYF